MKNPHFPVDSSFGYSLVPLKNIYVYEFIADYLDGKKKIVEREAGQGEIQPFYLERMVEGDPHEMVRRTVDDQKIADLERVFSGLEKASLPPIVLKKASRGYFVVNGMHRFTLSLLYRLKTVPVVFSNRRQTC